MENQRQQIRARIVEHLARLSPKKTIDITGQTRIIRDLEIDSLAVMNFILLLEEQFDISIPLERVAEVETVDDLVAAVADLTGASAA